jgi:hypothetical protein
MTRAVDMPGSRSNSATFLRAALELGPAPLALYAAYRFSLASGLAKRRTIPSRWGARPASSWLRRGISADPQGYLEFRRSHSGRFFFEPDEDLAPRLSEVVGDSRNVLSEADGVLDGTFRLFGVHEVHLGFPPDWAAPVDLEGAGGQPRIDLQSHWTVSDRLLEQIDVKLVWEASRFSWVFPLVRAARITGAKRYADGLWALLQSWMDVNQPNCGVNWSSGQEVALRLMAVVFAAYGMAPFWSEAPTRMLEVAEFIALHAARIPPTMIYARAQGNNHLITEAAALYTTGVLFPELRQSRHWLRIGRSWLMRGLRRQIFGDGGYIQHSANYHRLVLQVATWAGRLSALNQDPLPDDCVTALARSAGCLEALVDPGSGEAPNFGPNDGAHFLPLTSRPYADFRPTVQAASLAFRGRASYPQGPWDELSVWLGLVPASSPSEESSHPLTDEFPEAGLSIMGGERTRAIIRCAKFTSRPGHSDQLHFDLWRDGRNIARDPGSYRYKADPPWDNSLAQARVHNSVTVAGMEPMQQVGRFLWLNWDHARPLGHWRSTDAWLEVFAGRREGYRHVGLSHVRTVVRAGDDLWLVVDDLTRPPGPHGNGMTIPPGAVAGWNLPDWLFALDGRVLNLEVPGEALPLRVELSAGEAGLYRAGQLVAGADVQPGLATWGWWSMSYGHKQPSLFLAVQIGGGLPLRLSTWWCFAGAAPTSLKVGWADPTPEGPSISWLSHEGRRLDL